MYYTVVYYSAQSIQSFTDCMSVIIYYSAYLLSISQVVCMNVYDIAMDFVLLDAFNDLDNPPSTIVAVLQNRWITDGMKKSVRHPIFSSFLLFSSPPLFTQPPPSLSSLPSPSRHSQLQYGPY